MSAVLPPNQVAPPTRRFDNGAQWLAALGDIPLDRVIFDPPPGTATEADLLRLVEGKKRLCELIDGTLVEKAMGYWEGVIAAIVIRILGDYVRSRGLGQVSGADSTMRMRAGNVRLPDVGFTSKERLPTTLAAIPTLSPDLAVEVLSPGNTAAEIKQKLAEYFESGTRLAWVIDPVSRTIAVYVQPGTSRVYEESESLTADPVLPGLTLSVAEVFEGVPRA
jgi:Uma2 family endonuclease